MRLSGDEVRDALDEYLDAIEDEPRAEKQFVNEPPNEEKPAYGDPPPAE